MTLTCLTSSQRRRWPGLIGLGLYGLALCTAPAVRADGGADYSVLHAFSSSEGFMPSGPLLQGADGRFYGNAAQGGSNNLGTVYAVSSAGALTVLHNFSGADGAGPAGPLVAATDGTLYGVTEYGGDNDAGTVFSISPSGRSTAEHSVRRGSVPGGSQLRAGRQRDRRHAAADARLVRGARHRYPVPARRCGHLDLSDP